MGDGCQWYINDTGEAYGDWVDVNSIILNTFIRCTYILFRISLYIDCFTV
jgi:hypothetical protein